MTPRELVDYSAYVRRMARPAPWFAELDRVVAQLEATVLDLDFLPALDLEVLEDFDLTGDRTHFHLKTAPGGIGHRN